MNVLMLFEPELIVANSVSDDHDPFGSDVNRVTIIGEGEETELSVLPKSEVARLIWDRIVAISVEKDCSHDSAAGALDLGAGR